MSQWQGSSKTQSYLNASLRTSKLQITWVVVTFLDTYYPASFFHHIFHLISLQPFWLSYQSNMSHEVIKRQCKRQKILQQIHHVDVLCPFSTHYSSCSEVFAIHLFMLFPLSLLNLGGILSAATFSSQLGFIEIFLSINKYWKEFVNASIYKKETKYFLFILSKLLYLVCI